MVKLLLVMGFEKALLEDENATKKKRGAVNRWTRREGEAFTFIGKTRPNDRRRRRDRYMTCRERCGHEFEIVPSFYSAVPSPFILLCANARFGCARALMNA